MINSNKQLALYKVVAARLLVEDMTLHEASKVEHGKSAAGNGPLAKKLAAQYVDAMVRTRKMLVQKAIAEAQNEADLQRVVYFFMPTYSLAMNLHKANRRLDWEKIWKMDQALVKAGKTIKKGMMKAWLDPSRAMARKRLVREFEGMKGNLAVPRKRSRV